MAASLPYPTVSPNMGARHLRHVVKPRLHEAEPEREAAHQHECGDPEQLRAVVAVREQALHDEGRRKPRRRHAAPERGRQVACHQRRGRRARAPVREAPRKIRRQARGLERDERPVDAREPCERSHEGPARLHERRSAERERHAARKRREHERSRQKRRLPEQHRREPLQKHPGVGRRRQARHHRRGRKRHSGRSRSVKAVGERQDRERPRAGERDDERVGAHGQRRRLRREYQREQPVGAAQVGEDAHDARSQHDRGDGPGACEELVGQPQATPRESAHALEGRQHHDRAAAGTAQERGIL